MPVAPWTLDDLEPMDDQIANLAEPETYEREPLPVGTVGPILTTATPSGRAETPPQTPTQPPSQPTPPTSPTPPPRP